ncbi:hypothetical protein FEM48_Zijuj11G0041500 [Ziziphus jujuba var. spinosa]|uniref:Uncharacterized protein n=1 Tax=Ziziphus jujuba var. spinosa TaxID=714518 RepID=A0A978UGR2_ZIZJJ|nr:hypothetical protein FEM48_Zijuj11G0041500 [Ziziphus jujuba var. spinosa]
MHDAGAVEFTSSWLIFLFMLAATGAIEFNISWLSLLFMLATAGAVGTVYVDTVHAVAVHASTSFWFILFFIFIAGAIGFSNFRIVLIHNYKKLFLIEARWEEDDDEEMEIENDTDGEDLEISLHAMAGIHAPKPMRIWGGLKGHSMVALIDYRSTHNFISSE